MRSATLTVLGCLVFALPAAAERSPISATELAATATAAGGARAAYFEDFESFAPGGLVGQNGWSGWAPNASVTSVAPIGGALSARHTSDGSEWTGFELVCPVFPASYGIVAADVRISAPGVTYQFGVLGDTPSPLGGTYFNTRVQFDADGGISVLQSVGGAGVLVPTGRVWQPGKNMQIAVETRADGTLTVYRNTLPIFTGLDIGFAAQGLAGRSTQFYGWTDNAPGYAGVNLTLDNFTNVLTPEPASLVLLSLALVLRRR